MIKDFLDAIVVMCYNYARNWVVEDVLILKKWYLFILSSANFQDEKTMQRLQD
jgi:hypothetical protein